MKLLKSSLLASAAGFAAVAGAQAADLPVKSAAPIEYVRVCSAYGAGFFFIPGTDTCIRISGRARFEMGYSPTLNRSLGAGASTNNGDTTGYRGLARINIDARTQTAYGTLRAFTRLECASRTGATSGIRSGTQERQANAFGATGQDQSGRVQQFVNTDKAFIQFAGLTAGRASSFYDFYAHDFEISAATANSDVQSTNLIAYTSKLGDSGLSATVSIEDPSFRRNGIYSQESTAQNAPGRILIGNVNGVPSFESIDLSERNRTPDFVGVLRYDAAWGSLQLSGAGKELNTGNPIPFGAFTAAGGIPAFAGGSIANPLGGANGGTAGFNAAARRPSSEFGWAVQAGAKFNLPFIAPGDTLYLQGAYGEGATLYTGFSTQPGSYTTNILTNNGGAFNQYVADASLNPLTGKLELSNSFTVTAAYLHYWSPEWRSAFFGSYGELNFARGARAANLLAYAGTSLGTSNNAGSGQFLGLGPSAAISPVLRDNYQFIGGASIIWSPVKDLDIGLEGYYTSIGVKGGRVIDQTQAVGLSAAAVNAGLAAGTIKTVTNQDNFFLRGRVQRDF